MRKFNNTIGVRLTNQQIKELAAMAIYEHRSKGAVIRRLLEQRADQLSSVIDLAPDEAGA